MQNLIPEDIFIRIATIVTEKTFGAMEITYKCPNFDGNFPIRFQVIIWNQTPHEIIENVNSTIAAACGLII